MTNNLPNIADCAFAVTPPPVQFTDNQSFNILWARAINCVELVCRRFCRQNFPFLTKYN